MSLIASSFADLRIPYANPFWLTAIVGSIIILAWLLKEALRSGRAGETVQGNYSEWTRLHDDDNSPDPF